jgi:flagellar biosynthesis/type III secretory pathway protein FliH
MRVLFSVLPEGMMKVMEGAEFGVQRVPPDTVVPTLQEITSSVIGEISAAEKVRVVVQPEFKSEPLLPPIGEEFRENFIGPDGNLLNTIVLRKRLQGLVSYYRGSKKELMPEVVKDEVVRVPFTPYSQAEYQRVRLEELKREEDQKKKKKEAVPGAAGKMANLWADIYELSKLKQPNSYRMASRQTCNFSFPEGITRPRPSDETDIVVDIGVDKEIADADVEVVEDVLEVEDDEGAAEKEDADIDDGERKEAIEEARAAGDEEGVEEAEEEGKAILIPAVEAVSGPLAAAAAAMLAKKTLTALNVMKAKQAKEAEACKQGLIPGEKYLDATRRAKRCLETFATPRLRLYKPGIKIQDQIAAGTPPDPERLVKYSPKFAAILQNILTAPGSSLVYSQFLDMEGIGIFLVTLRINEFQPIQIESDETGTMRFSAATIANLQKGPAAGVNRYLSFTGQQTSDKWKGSNAIRNMALKLFNARYEEEEGIGRFIDLPPDMSKILVDAG